MPENREKPDSRFIELHFIKLNSTWDEDSEDEDDEGEEEDGDGSSDDDSDSVPAICNTGD